MGFGHRVDLGSHSVVASRDEYRATHKLEPLRSIGWYSITLAIWTGIYTITRCLIILSNVYLGVTNVLDRASFSEHGKLFQRVQAETMATQKGEVRQLHIEGQTRTERHATEIIKKSKD